MTSKPGLFLPASRTRFIEEFIQDVANTSTSYYITFGRNEAWPDDANPPVPNTNIATSIYKVSNDMLFGKQVYGPDIAYMIPNKPWVSGKIYDFYDDQDPDLLTKDFYVINSSNRVYKCLFNNYGSPSTVEPNDTNPNVDFNTYPDGYKWKYMYRITRQQANKFSTLEYVPVYEDPQVKQYAENGAIHVIVVDESGSNYPSAKGTVASRISPTLVQISNANSESISGIYNDSSFYIESGTGNNFITNISNYVVNTSGKFVFTTEVTPPLNSTSHYRIGPQIKVSGDGSGLKAFAFVEPSANSVYDIRVINRGQNYSFADVSIVANSIALGANGGGAVAHAIISPPGGHGFDNMTELGSDVAGISIETTPLDGLPSWPTYRQIALIYNPKWSFDNTTYLYDTFIQYTTLITGFNKVQFTPGDKIRGFTSKAFAEVIYSDDTNIYVKNVSTDKQFTPYETIIADSTGQTTVVEAINTGDLVEYTGKVMYYKNIEPVTRDANTREQVKLYFKF